MNRTVSTVSAIPVNVVSFRKHRRKSSQFFVGKNMKYKLIEQTLGLIYPFEKTAPLGPP